MDKPDSHLLNQVTNRNTGRDGPEGALELPGGGAEKQQYCFQGIHASEEGAWDKPKFQDTWKITGLHFHTCQSPARQGKVAICLSQMEGDWKDRTANRKCNPGMDPGPGKNQLERFLFLSFVILCLFLKADLPGPRKLGSIHVDNISFCFLISV